MLEHIKAVLFDLDGTLVDSMWVWNDIDVEYLGRFGLSLPETLQKEIEGMSFTETAVYIKQKFSIPDPIEKMKEDWNVMAFDKYVNEVPLKKGFLNFLRSAGRKESVLVSLPVIPDSLWMRSLLHMALQNTLTVS
ncbi:MAG: HAD family hydrolase [Suilimivivens sp.]